MKRMLTVLSLCMTFAMGQTITPIADIQFVADPETSDASPLDGTEVTISGVVTAEFWDSGSRRSLFIQDADTAWSGVYAFEFGGWDNFAMTFDVGVGRTVLMEGDSVTLTATVDEYFGETEMVDATALVVHGQATNPPAPIVITPAMGAMEKYEGVLVKFENVTVADEDLGFGEWSFNVGTDTLGTNDVFDYYYYPKDGAGIDAIVGVMSYSFSARKVLPRLARDVVQAGDFVRVQRIQQVLGSALVLTPDSLNYDHSYMVGDTLTSLGIVTVPTAEISGIDSSVTPNTGFMRFIWQDPNGGPFSSMLSYFGDPTAFPALFVGDSIKITGYIFEFHGGGNPAGFTELFITEPIEILGANANVPAPNVLTTNDFRLPIDAEQWELNMVTIEGATVIDNNLPFGEWSIDDGSGTVNIGSGTNTMGGEDIFGNELEAGAFVRPPVNTAVASVTGYVYHAYGGYSDSTTYKVYPVTPSAIELGGGPPSITGYATVASAFGLADAVTVSADVADGSGVASVVATYRVDGGTWTDAALTNTDGNWSGAIPATNTEGALVEYFLKATDDGGDSQAGVESAFFPSDTSAKLFGYYTKAAGTSIGDVQYSAFESGDSYYDGSVVTLTGVVTTFSGDDGSNFVIQSEATMGFGVVAIGMSGYAPEEGDEVTITGRVDESSSSSFQFELNTVIRDVSAVTVNSQGNVIAPLAVTAAELIADPEGYEGTLVTLGSSTVTALNSFDRTLTDGTAEYLIDDDFMAFMSQGDMAHDSLMVDDVLSSVTGVWNFAWGTFKVQLRGIADFGSNLAIDGNTVPLRFDLSQNYPNPFNPTTTINYSLAKNAKHTLKIYNLRGALVETLVSDVRPAGRYSIVWNARNYASGMYFLRLDAEDFHSTKKLILLK